MRNIIWKFVLALIGALLAAFSTTPAWAGDLQFAPSAANQCGRLHRVSLAPIASTRGIARYPDDAQREGQSGQTILRLLIDKYGFAREADVVVSSGYALLDQAAVDSIKDRWRWEPPPSECRESGVVIGETYNWNLHWVTGGGRKPYSIYLDNPLYPVEARTHKQSGTGEVKFTISPDNKVTDAQVTSSAGSPAFDAAMVALIHDFSFPTSGTASTPFTGTQRFEFIPHDDPASLAVLMGPAITPKPVDLKGKQPFFTFVDPYPAPSLANGCGRSARVFLEPSPTDVNPRYPVEAAASGKQGRTVLYVLVDKGGTASDVTVAQSSGSPLLDEAAVKGLKGLWHFQTPPAECADQGVRLLKNIDWFYGNAPQMRVMAGDPGYPAEAIANKLSGSGMVQITRSQDGELQSTRVVTSTNSNILDAAMVKIISDARFTPGTKEWHRSWTNQAAIDFVGDPDAMRAAAAAPVRRIAPLAPPPSIANDCGRASPVYLAPVDSSHALVPIPMVSVEQTNRFHPALSFRAQGALSMHVLVDKNGNAASVTVAQSSAPPEMERAVTGTVKESYRWEPPPPECADRGVALDVNYIYTWAPEKLQIYADDPAYPDAARARSMGAAGIVQIRFHRDQIDDTKMVVGTKSPELDEAMIKVVSDRLLADMRTDPQPGSAILSFPVMFMPGFVASPKQQAARTQQSAATASPPATLPQ